MKKSLKRIISLLLAISMAFSYVPVLAHGLELEIVGEIETAGEEHLCGEECEHEVGNPSETDENEVGNASEILGIDSETLGNEAENDTEVLETVGTNIVPLYQDISVAPGQLDPATGEIIENEIYGYVLDYELKKGHTLSISNKDYVFSVRKLADGNYNTMLKQATASNFVATENMTVGMLIRRPDKTAVTAEELASIKIIDSQYGMIGVEGYAHRFTVEAETIDGGTATTRAAIFLPESYSEDGEATPIIVMTNGYSAYLTESTWNGNTADNVGIIRNYLSKGYAVFVVNNTKNHTGKTPDLGCPQLVDSYLKAYEYIQEHFNVEEKISIHSRSFGTFAAVRIMLEVPELIKCAVMTGPRVSIKAEWPGLDKAFIANRFGFEDTTGATYEADKMVGHDPYTDVDGENYKLPPTFWMMAEGDSTARPLEFIGKIEAHGNDVHSKTYSGIDHTGICTLNQSAPFADALEFLNEHRNGEEEETLEGKTISILGDSISTYVGISNNTDYNSTIGKNAIYYTEGKLGVYQPDTWWQQAIDALGMELLVNNSWSGSTVLHTRSGTAGSYVGRCVQLHNDHTGEEPDVIAVFMGTNDFSYYQSKLGTADIDYSKLISENGDGTFSYATPATTCEAYAVMLHKMTVRYTDAEIYCMGLLPRRDPDKDGKDVVPAPTQFNAELKKVVEHFGCIYVDIESPIPAKAEEFDKYIGDARVHPGVLGMDKMTEALLGAMLGEKVEICGVSRNLTNAKLDTEVCTVIKNSGFSANVFAEEGCENLSVAVTMGGTDITATAYKDGKITIPKVTGDIVISASAVRPAQNFRWEFDGTNLVSVGETENNLTKLGGTTENGLLKNTYYSIENSVMLYHNRPWTIEFRASGSWSGMIFSEKKASDEVSNIYLFKTRTTSGLVAFGEKGSSQYNNYGVPLAALGIDTTAEHTYRIENRVAEDGSKMAYLFVDGKEVGAMNNYFIDGNDDRDTEDSWISGKDFVFSYIGASNHAIDNCKMEYIAVWEGGKPSESLSLRYDDRYDVSGKTVEIIDAGKPTSYKVGYGVAEGTFDDAVITIDGDKIIATGIGTAKVRIDGVLYEVTVEAAPISLLLLIGQSNMEGMVGNAKQSIACEDGQVYSTYAKANGLTGDAGLTAENAGNYVPSALTGEYSVVNVNGNGVKLSGYPVDSLTESGDGKYGMDSGIAYEWVKQTGEKVWIVNAAHGASSISSWQKGQSNFEEAVALLSACQNVLKKEIAAGHYTFSHMGYYWCQGCADEQQTAEWYANRYIAMHDNLKAELAFDADLDENTEDATFEFGNIVLVMAGHDTATGYRKGVYEDDSDKFFATFMELEMRGPRVAQIWLANNPELEDIYIVSTIAQDWVTMPDGSDGVEEYFTSHYENGIIDYPTQVEQNESWYKPTTPAEVKNSIHYYQVGYNEVGRESVRNTMYILGIKEKPEVETTVTFYDWTGYKEVSEIQTVSKGISETLAVPFVQPCYESKTVTYNISDNLEYVYYDLLDKESKGGTLSDSLGQNNIPAVERKTYSYRFELSEGEMVSVSDGVFTGNPLKRADQTHKYYRAETPIILRHDKEWVVEFSSEQGERFMALSCQGWFSSKTEYSDNAYFIFKRTDSGKSIISFGEYKNQQYEYWGIKQGMAEIDWDMPHVYSFRNIINDNGSNIIHIYIDDVFVGTTANRIINNVVTLTDETYFSGKDFLFPFIGAGGTFALNSEQMLWMNIWENGKPSKSLSLRYDDRYDVSGKTVEIIDAGKPTSNKVGYGVAEGTFDDAVITLDGEALVATGIGTAKVHIDGILYEVTVEAAPISLLLLIGQSNMRGSEGNADQSIVCPDGMVYATFGDDRGDAAGIMNVNNATNFAPSALTGEYSTINVNGTTENLSYYPVYSLTEEGKGTFGPDSGFAYEWVKQTGEKVWVVNAAHGGSAISSWQPNATNYKEAVLLFGACQETLQKEIAAGHFILSHMGYFWCQGCSDAAMTAEQYVHKYLAMHEGFTDTLAFDHDSDSSTEEITFEFGGIIPVRAGNESSACYRQGTYTDTTTAKYHESFKDLRFTGPRVAQYWMGNNPELEDIWVVCNIGEDWVWMPDGTNGVSDYFNANYENGTVDYTTQIAQKASWYTPTTPAAVHDSIHYNQIGYNEIGRESVRNALIMLGEIEAPETETIVEFLSWDGYTEVSEITASNVGTRGTLVVPMVYPLWEAKNIEYTLSEGLRYEYYDLLAESMDITGTLKAGNANVTVNKAEPGAHFEEHLSTLPEKVCCGLNLWNILEHDKYYFANGTHWGTHSSGNVYSVTIPVNAGDKIFATSFGKAGENGSASSNGIRMTYFSEYGVVKTMAPSEVYPEFTANGGYLVVPEGAVAINIAMWNNSDENEIYILNREHDKTEKICSICGKDSHEHDWSDWEMTAVPEKDEYIIEERICSGCGETETREVESVWQKFDLAEHLSTLPENVCSKINLWNILEHDDEFLSGGKNWDVHSSGKVYSVTFAVNEGDKIHATSFGKGGTNGGSANGIRVSFFDAYGVVKTLEPAETYAEFTANGGYLVAPEGTIAVNIPMWNNSDENETYILNREHDYESAVIEPTCTEQGYTTRTCSVCGDSYIDSYVNAIGHSFGEWKVTKEATCEAKGIERRDCENCDHYETREVAAKGHDYKAVVTGPTCTEQGYTTHTCAVCGDSYMDSYVDATGHDYEAVVTEPTCEEQGYTTHTCVCGESYVDNYTPVSSEHKYDDGVCVWCGASVIGSGWLVPELSEGDYSMVVLPDTQNMVAYHSEHYYNMMQWIADNADTFNIKAVLHMGDMVNSNTEAEWTVCETGTDILADSGIAWMPMMGNHDSSVWFNKYYDYETYGTNQSWFGGSYEEGKLDHTYWFVTAGEREYMIISLGWAPSWEVLDWAKGVVEENSDKNVIIACHAYMNKDGTFLSKGDAHCVSSYLTGYPDGDDVWNAFKGYENVVLAMGGHISSPDIITRTDKNGISRDVYSMLIDNQDEDITYRYGMVAVLTFRESSDTVDVNWYGTRYDALYGAENQFEITVPHLCDHKFEVTKKEATCTEAGGKYYICAICGANYTEAETDALGHDYTEIITEPTCTEDGCTILLCNRCGDEKIKTAATNITDRFVWTDGKMIIATTGEIKDYSHWKASDYTDISDCDFIEIKTANTASLTTSTGLAFYDADKNYISGVIHTNKSGVYGVLIHELEVPKNAVYIRSTWYSPSHPNYDEAFGEFWCKAKIYDIVPALGHSFGEWAVTKEATCEAKGIERRDCANCDHYETREIKAIGHTEVVDKAVAPTCTETGLTEGKHCYVCGKVIVAQTVVKATGHSFGEWKVTKEATCEAKGIERRDCANCDHYETREIKAIGHTEVVDKAVAPTCTETGLTEGKHCSVCGKVIVAQSVVKATGHSFGEWKATKEATCEAKGEERRDCANCDHYETRDIKATGHTEVIDKAVEPTCTETGLTEGKHCSVCGEVLVAQTVVTAKGHDYKAVVTEPTCTEQGYTTHTCSVCGESYVDSYVDATGHSFGEWYETKAPTAAEKGEERRDCANCGHYEVREIEATGEETKTIYGDINGDGRVNVLDANLIRRYAARLITFDDSQLIAADVNGDERVNVLDANLVRRFAARLITEFPVEG